MMIEEDNIEENFIKKLVDLKYIYRDDIKDLESLEQTISNNTFRVSQLINSFHRYDVIILINGLPLVQIELKTLQVNPKKPMEQIINYKNDKGNGYVNTLLCLCNFL